MSDAPVLDRNLFKIFADNPALMAVTSMPERKYVEINKAFTAKLGYTSHDIIGKTVFETDLMPAADIDAMIEAVGQAGGISSRELRVKAKDGSLHTLLFSGNILEEGGNKFFLMVSVDITGRRSRLTRGGTGSGIAGEKNSRAELERLFSLSLDLLCIADRDGNLLKTNPAWTEILGYAAAELASRKYRHFVHPGDLDATLRAMERLAAGEQTLSFVNRCRAKDGAYRHIEWRARPYGKLIYAAGRDITERIASEERIREIALRDPLTNAYNRKYIFEQLEIILAEYKRTGRVFSVALLDIDFFRNINDQHGHQAGDFILTEFAALLRSNLRPYDLLGRYGGEEFIVISPNAWTEQARSIIKRILDKVRNSCFVYNGTPLGFTFSAGIADCFECGPDTLSAGKTIEMIIEKADSRLYKAKRTGRDKIVPWRVTVGRLHTAGH
jgi:diguanylate cyclase (GGDEF)-like protein/PAS domain S-box-containing protein